MLRTDYNSGRHSVYLLHVHLVFVPKYRKAVFDDVILADLENIFKNVCLKFESELVEFNGEKDHVHLLVSYPPKHSVSGLVNSLKGVSSRLLRDRNYMAIRKKLWGDNLWSPSYFASACGGAPVSIIKQYIEQQNRPN